MAGGVPCDRARPFGTRRLSLSWRTLGVAAALASPVAMVDESMAVICFYMLEKELMAIFDNHAVFLDACCFNFLLIVKPFRTGFLLNIKQSGYPNVCKVYDL